VLNAFHNEKNIEVEIIYGIYDYKSFYDKFIDTDLKVFKEDLAMLGYRITALSEIEKQEYPFLITSTNYRYL
jgi:hypothetical protein